MYQGHAGQGGLQNHSVGSHYPYIIYAQETERGMLWGVLDGAKGHDTGPIFFDFGLAYDRADDFKSGAADIYNWTKQARDEQRAAFERMRAEHSFGAWEGAA